MEAVAVWVARRLGRGDVFDVSLGPLCKLQRITRMSNGAYTAWSGTQS